jgi:hypothetical protein
MKRVLGSLLALLIPVVAAADPITAFALFAGNQVSISGGTTLVQGMTGANASVVTTGVTLGGGATNTQLGPIKSAGTVALQAVGVVNGNIIAGGAVTLSGGGAGVRVNGTVDVNLASGTALSVSGTSHLITGVVTKFAAASANFGGGATQAANAPAGVVNGTPTPYVTTAIPAATAFSSGGSNVTVAAAGTTTLTPGSYGAIQLNANATLKLTAGNYYFDSFNSVNSALGTFLNLDVSGGAINIYVTGNVTPGAGFNMLGVTAATAHLVYLETLANFNWAAGANNGTFYGTIFASGPGTSTASGNITFGGDSTLVGRAWARRNITTDQDFTQMNAPFPSAPEPTTLTLFGVGLLALAGLSRRRMKR